jgi:hypothetical protein
MADTEAQGAGNPSDEQEVDPSDLTDEELRAFFGGGEPEVSEETPNEGETDDHETETQEEVTEAGNTAEETESEEERLAKMRVRPKDDKDQQILDLYKSEGWNKSLAEAAAVINGIAQPEESPQAEVTPANEENSSESTLEKLNSEVAALEKEATDAAEDLDTAKAFALQKDIMDKRIKALRVETEMQRDKEKAEASQYEQYRQKAVESRDRALARFPVLQNAESVERKLFDNFVKEKQEDPDYASVFDSPKWVELMANEFSQEHDLSSPAAPDLVDLNRPTKTNTKVLTSADNTSSKPKAKITPDGVRDNMHRLDRDTLYKMLGQ